MRLPKGCPDIDEPLAMLCGGVISFYHADGLGSITTLTNSAGSVIDSYIYDSFGNSTALTGTTINPFRYTGREFDPETNLYYYRARYYEASTGRFLSEDPLGFGGGANFYGYVGNDPVSLTDPFGLICVPKKLSDRGKKCQQKVMAAVQDKLGMPVFYIGPKEFPLDKNGKPMPGTDPNDPGMRNGAYNFDFWVPGYTPPNGGLGNGCGRFSPGWTGIGPSLHIVLDTPGCNPASDPSSYDIQDHTFSFTAHIDSGYSGSIVGVIVHGVKDVLLKIKNGCGLPLSK